MRGGRHIVTGGLLCLVAVSVYNVVADNTDVVAQAETAACGAPRCAPDEDSRASPSVRTVVHVPDEREASLTAVGERGDGRRRLPPLVLSRRSVFVRPRHAPDSQPFQPLGALRDQALESLSDRRR